MRGRAIAAVLGLIAGVIGMGCTRDDLLSGSQPPGLKLDAGRFVPDAGTGVRLDSGAPVDPDSGVVVDRDSGVVVEPDAGPPPPPPDAGPSCVCPSLPAACAMPAVDTPAFSPVHPDMQEQLLGVISCADHALHGAIYETSWDCVVDALLARLASDPDVVIQLLIDDDQCPRANGVLTCELARLEVDPRVTILDDARSRYMHHKFFIADGRTVWVGSANMTRDSFCQDSNNSVVIEEPAIVAAYEAEFQRMFTDRELGPVARTATTAGPYTVYFSPETPISSPPAWFAALRDSIAGATTSVTFMIYALTRVEISDALIQAKMRGLDVHGLIAPEYVRDPTVQALIAAQIPVRVAPVHSKVLIVDDRLVATGSPNWSQNSWENDENSLWISSSTIAAAYRAELERVYAGALPP